MVRENQKRVTPQENARGSSFQNKRRSEAGQVLLIAALGMVILLGFLGLSIDFGYLRYLKRQLQTAADAAAIAGASELAYNDVTTAAKADSAANGFTDGTNSVTVTVNNPPLAGQHIGDTKYVEAVVAINAHTFFSRAFGVTRVSLSARAVAHQGNGNNCVFALNPTSSSSLTVDGFASLSSQCGIVVESNSNGALSCAFFASISASSIGVVGGVQSFLCSISPSAHTGINVPNPSDPLASLPKPAVGSCTFTSQRVYTSTSSPASNPTKLNPGVYCGGILIQPGANVIFNSGIYTLTSTGGSHGTGGMAVDVGSNVTTNATNSPNGVMFYNYGPIGAITFNFTSFSAGNQVSLTAPTSGTYQGMLFFQDPQDTASAQILGSSSVNTTLQGSYYFPQASVVFAFSGLVQYDILVANKIEFAYLTFSQGNFTGSAFSNNYTSLANGSPVKGAGVLDE